MSKPDIPKKKRLLKNTDGYRTEPRSGNSTTNRRGVLMQLLAGVGSVIGVSQIAGARQAGGPDLHSQPVDEPVARKALLEVRDTPLVETLMERDYLTRPLTDSFSFAPIDMKSTLEGALKLDYAGYSQQVAFITEVENGHLLLSLPVSGRLPHTATFFPADDSSPVVYEPSGETSTLPVSSTSSGCSDWCSEILSEVCGYKHGIYFEVIGYNGFCIYVPVLVCRCCIPSAHC